MKLLEKMGSGVVRKAMLGAALFGSLAFLAAGTASARPRVVVGFGGPVVVRGYYGAPAPYWGPVYVDRNIASVITTGHDIATGMRGCVAGAKYKASR